MSEGTKRLSFARHRLIFIGEKKNMMLTYWKRNPNTHVRVGMKTNGSTVARITHPETSEEGAYVKQWDGHTILKKNPRYG